MNSLQWLPFTYSSITTAIQLSQVVVSWQIWLGRYIFVFLFTSWIIPHGLSLDFYVSLSFRMWVCVLFLSFARVEGLPFLCLVVLVSDESTIIFLVFLCALFWGCRVSNNTADWFDCRKKVGLWVCSPWMQELG